MYIYIYISTGALWSPSINNIKIRESASSISIKEVQQMGTAWWPVIPKWYCKFPDGFRNHAQLFDCPFGKPRGEPQYDQIWATQKKTQNPIVSKKYPDWFLASSIIWGAILPINSGVESSQTNQPTGFWITPAPIKAVDANLHQRKTKQLEPEVWFPQGSLTASLPLKI